MRSSTPTPLQPSKPDRVVGMDDDMKKRCIAKLTDHVVEKLIVRDNNRTTSSSLDNYDPDQLRRIAEKRIKEMVPDFHAPVHPTYAFMIHRAITELNNEGGSDKESISKFIRLEYKDLPLAHESLLGFQLNKLCKKGEVLLSDSGCYMLPAGDNVQEKQGMKQTEEPHVEKNGCGGGRESRHKGSSFKGNEADVELPKLNLSSKQMIDAKENGKAGVQPVFRWSRTLQSNKPQEEEPNGHINNLLEVPAQTVGDATKDHIYQTKSSTAYHQLKDEHFEINDEPLEPPGFPSKKVQLIEWKQQAQADQHPKESHILIPRRKVRPRKIVPNGGLLKTEKPKKKQGRGRPRKQKPDELLESKTYVEVETVAERAAMSWDWDEVSTRIIEHNSNSGNDITLAAQNKEGTKKRKELGMSPKMDKEDHSEIMDSPKVKRGRGKGFKSICYTDTSITDLVYSQDHHLQPMSRIKGRPRKL